MEPGSTVQLPPYLEPNYPAIVRQCQWCAKPLNEVKYETVPVRQLEGSLRRGKMLVCLDCLPVLREKAAFIAQKSAEYEMQIQNEGKQQLVEFQRELTRELFVGGAEPKDEPRQPEPPRGEFEIPHPSKADG